MITNLKLKKERTDSVQLSRIFMFDEKVIEEKGIYLFWDFFHFTLLIDPICPMKRRILIDDKIICL